MAYAREQQDSSPLFRAFVQVGEGVPGKGDRADPRQPSRPRSPAEPNPEGRAGGGCRLLTLCPPTLAVV